MSRLIAAVLIIAAGQDPVSAPMTFDEALSLARTHMSPASSSVPTVVRTTRRPDVRAEFFGNTSRTLDPFTAEPLDTRSASSVIAFDYALWESGAARAHVNALRRDAERGGMDDAHFTDLVDAFGELYVAQTQTETVRASIEQATSENARTEQLLAQGEISNLIAAERSDAFLALQSRLLDLDARRLDAAARLRLLTGADREPAVAIDLTAVDALPPTDNVADDTVDAANLALDESQARLKELSGGSTGFRAILSGFAGLGAAHTDFREDTSSGSFGIYGLRIGLTYPLFAGPNAGYAQARGDVEHLIAIRDAALTAARERAASYRIRAQTAEARVTILQKSVDITKQREESLQRLVAAGVRSENDLEQVRIDRMRRESELLATRVERWKTVKLLERMTPGGRGHQP